jgi:Ca2+-binding EF-hand superfamily protein
MPLDQMFKDIDTNGDKKLSLDEVYEAIEGFAHDHDMKLPEGWKQEVEHVFNKVDASKDGFVTMDEIKGAIFNAVDENDDGEWSLKEVTQAI